MRINTYLTYTDRSGVKLRQLINTVGSKDEAFRDCWHQARHTASGVNRERWDVNLMISSQFEWCAALQYIDKDTGETVCTHMWGYEEAALAKLGNRLGTHEDWIKTGS